MLIRVINNLTDEAQTSSLSNGESSGTTIVRVKNINPFRPNWAVQLGKTGESQSEVGLLQSSAISGTSLTLRAATNYEHPTDSPIYATKFDQLVFMRSTVGTAGTATAMTNGTVTITPDNAYTVFDDTSAASSYAYKAKYHNSITSEESEDSDWITPSGATWYSLGKLRDRILDKAATRGISADPSFVDDQVNAFLEKMNAAAVGVNEDYALGTVAVGFAQTTGLGTITSSDFLFPTEVWVTYDGTTPYRATSQKANEAYPTQTFSQTRPYFNFQGDTVFKVLPADTAGTATFEYQKLFTRLVNDGDELPLYMRNQTESFVDYGYGQILKQDAQTQESGEAEEGKAMGAIQTFKMQIAPRVLNDQPSVRYVEPVSGEEY